MYIQNEMKYFKAVDPSQLLKYLKEKQEEIKLSENKIKNILPFLNSFSKTIII